MWRSQKCGQVTLSPWPSTDQPSTWPHNSGPPTWCNPPPRRCAPCSKRSSHILLFCDDIVKDHLPQSDLHICNTSMIVALHWAHCSGRLATAYVSPVRSSGGPEIIASTVRTSRPSPLLGQ